MNSTDPLIQVRGVSKRFRTLDKLVTASEDISLDIARTSTVALTGPSGSGKSTLLHLIGALDTPDSGQIIVDGHDITTMKRRQLADYRRTVGFVFQRFNLLPTLSVLDNVLAPTIPFKVHFDALARAHELLERVGLAGREQTLATRLSGGQQQRVALARALIFDPPLLLADEPTGNLDSKTGEEIATLLLSLREERNTTLLVATHDLILSSRFDEVVVITDGRLQADSARANQNEDHH